jgi:hypothetical protein
MPMLLTALAFCLLIALFTFAMTNEIRAFYKRSRAALVATSPSSRRKQ